MALEDKRLTDLTEKVVVPSDAWVHIVDPSDTTDHPDGSSFKAKRSSVSPNLTLADVVQEGSYTTDVIDANGGINVDNGFATAGIFTTDKGIFSDTDHSADIDDLSYVQKIYVDTEIASAVGGTIDPADYDLDQFNNANVDRFANMSDIPDISGKQDTLASGTNIKTIDGVTVLGSGNIDTLTTPQKTISGNVTLDDTYNGCIVKIKTTANITVPSTLMTDFSATFDAWAGATGTFIEGAGANIIETTLTLAPNKMATLYKDGATTDYKLKGETT